MQLILPWSSLPQDRARPSEQWDFLALVLSGAGWTDLVSGLAAVTTGSTRMNVKPGPLGIASDQGGVSSGTVYVPMWSRSDQPITIAAVFVPGATTMGTVIGLLEPGGWHVPQFLITTGSVQVQGRTNTSTLYTATAPDVNVAGTTDVVSVAACWTPGEGFRISANGKGVGSVSTTDTALFGHPYRMQFGGSASLRLYVNAAIRGRASNDDLIRISGSYGTALFAPRRIWVPTWVGGAGGVSLVVADAGHSHLADALGLTSEHLLTLADAAHAHTADVPVVSTQLLLTLNDTAQAHTADSATITVQSVLTLADTTHSHLADNLGLSTTGSTSLVLADTVHAHTADPLVLVTSSLLAVADAAQAHTADGVTLSTTGTANLVVADALQAHTADAFGLTAQSALAIADAFHAHLADVIVFLGSYVYVPSPRHYTSPARAVTFASLSRAASYISPERTVLLESGDRSNLFISPVRAAQFSSPNRGN